MGMARKPMSTLKLVVFPIQDDMFCSPNFYYPMSLTRYVVSFGAIPND